VQVSGQEEQPRVLLLSVPYALKAADAETVGGLPPSAFVLAATTSSTGSAATVAASPAIALPALSGTGTADFLPLWLDGAGKLGNSVLFQSGTGSSAKIGVNTAAPASTLDVKGGETVRGNLSLPATATATASSGKNSQPETLTASAFNSGTGSAVSQNFRWQAEPIKNNTGIAGGTINLLFGAGANAPVETGLKIGSNGQITFANGQSFPGAVASVGLSAPSSDFIVGGSPITKSGTLALNWKVLPTADKTPDAIVKRNDSGGFDSGPIYAYDPGSNGLAIVGSAGYLGVEGMGGPYGVYGQGTTFGVWGYGSSATGVYGQAINAGTGVIGTSQTGSGIFAESGGWAVNAQGDGTGTGVLASSAAGYAGWFSGDVNVSGTLSKGGGSFKIDHPLDPANKYLYHSFVESPDMMNIYNGNVATDGNGDAVVELQDWFEALNRDFRYQLTVLGQFAQAIVASKVANHRFAIKTDKPNVEVSWQVTGIRQDAWAIAHRIPVEELKPESERGFYLYPELYGAPREKGILWARFPTAMKQHQEIRAALAAQRPATLGEKP